MVTTVRDGSRARRAPAENHGSLRATSDVEHLPALRGIIDQRQIQRCAHGLRTKAPQDAGVQTQLALVTGSLLRQETLQITAFRSEEHTSELQSLMRISYAVFCLKYKNNTTH